MLESFSSAEWLFLSASAIALVMVVLYLRQSKQLRHSRARQLELEKENQYHSVNEERLQLLQDATSDGIWDWNTRTNEVYWSNKSFSMIGYEPHEFEITFEAWQKLVFPEDLPRCLKLIEASVESGEPLTMEYRYQTKDGRLLWVRVHGHWVKKDESGRATRLIGNHIDLSESKIAERTIEQQNRELEEKNRALMASNERAKSAMKAKDEFLSIISHELRSPLNPIIGFSELLIQEGSPDVVEKAETIHQSSLSMLRLVEDMLIYMRLQKHDFYISPAPTSLQTIIKNSIREIQSLEGAASIARIQYDSEGLIPLPEGEEIIVDPDTVQYVLTNLIENALTYSSDAPVIFRSGLLTDDKNSLRIEVIDQGIGIAEDKQKKIFDALYQVDSSYTRAYEGLGLGLAICKKATELLKGRIGVSSELNKGSKFWVEIPLESKEANRTA